MPQSHLYIFTEEQRNYQYTEESFMEEYMNFFEDVTILLDNDLKFDLKSFTFWDIIKVIMTLIAAFIIGLFLLCCLTIGFIAGLCIHCCRKTWQWLAGLFKN